MGGPISRILVNGKRVPERLRYYAGMATAMHGETIENSVRGQVFSCTLKEPVGVVGAIIPWNNPIGASMWKIGPALATGCTIVLKPAEEASLSCLRLGELILEAGVPPGCRQHRDRLRRDRPAPRSLRTRMSTSCRSPART